MYDDDYDAKKRLKFDEVYRVDIVKARNIDFHRKYFALINIGWEYLNEEQTKFFKYDREGFRKCVQIAAGYYTLTYSIKRKEWVEESVSISFEKMDELEFQDLYNKVRDVIFSLVEDNVSEDEFLFNLADF
ncbi:MAG: hypothetical protein BGP01_03315 [Paludibacter sp. 47-17]|nr:MAG: hypothetical protein BGP01_03315 [Paludibacter sp. 47-17]